jgi:hypothetical protein
MKSPAWLRRAKGEDWFKNGELTPYAEGVLASNEEVIKTHIIKGWEQMAEFLGYDERVLRDAYDNDPKVRGCIFAVPAGSLKRYYSYDLLLADLYNSYLMNRREDWPRRADLALVREAAKRSEKSRPG